jgi:hypothetical protein
MIITPGARKRAAIATVADDTAPVVIVGRTHDTSSHEENVEPSVPYEPKAASGRRQI